MNNGKSLTQRRERVACRFFVLLIYSIENNHKNRQPKSKSLLKRELVTYKFLFDSKKYFSRILSGGVFKQTSDFVSNVSVARNRIKLRQNTVFLFRKVKTSFREQLHFLLVLKDIADITVKKLTKGIEIIPCNALSVS